MMKKTDDPRQTDLEDFTGHAASLPPQSDAPVEEHVSVGKALTADRMETYAHPLDNFARVQAMKALVRDCPDVEVREALEMLCVKIARLVCTPDHKDSIDDIDGYAETIRMIHRERIVRGI